MTEPTTIDPGLVVHTTLGPEVAALRPVGYVDLSTVDFLRRQTNACLACGARSITVDASGLTFIDSSGLAALIAAQTVIESRGGTMTVVGASDQLVRLMGVTGLAELIDLR